MSWKPEYWSIGRVMAKRDSLGKFEVGHRSLPSEWVKNLGLSLKGHHGRSFSEEQRKVCSIATKKWWNSLSELDRKNWVKKLSFSIQGVKMKTNSASCYVGVSWLKCRKKWISGIYVNGKQMRLGSFSDEIDAARAYDAAALRYFGENARCNFDARIKSGGDDAKIIDT